MKNFFKKLFGKAKTKVMPLVTGKSLHPRLAQLVNEGWMAPAVTSDGRPLVVNGVTYYGYVRNAEKLTYSRNLAYEAAITEYNEIHGHSKLLKEHLRMSKLLASEIFNYRHTDPQRSELSMQHLIGLTTSTEVAIASKHPIGFVCQVAAIFFVAENEDPDINDSSLQEEKAEAFLKATEFHDFFFTMQLVPLNVLQTLSDLNLTLFTAEAYQQLAVQARAIYSSLGSDSIDSALKNASKYLMATSIATIHSYEHLFTRLSNYSTSSEKTPSKSGN